MGQSIQECLPQILLVPFLNTCPTEVMQTLLSNFNGCSNNYFSKRMSSKTFLLL